MSRVAAGAIVALAGLAAGCGGGAGALPTDLGWPYQPPGPRSSTISLGAGAGGPAGVVVLAGGAVGVRWVATDVRPPVRLKRRFDRWGHPLGPPEPDLVPGPTVRATTATAHGVTATVVPGDGDLRVTVTWTAVEPAVPALELLALRHQGPPRENEYLDELGFAVAVADLDGDGRGDVVAGAPGETLPGVEQVGEVRAWLSDGAPANLARWTPLSTRPLFERSAPDWLDGWFATIGRSVAVVRRRGAAGAAVLVGAPGFDSPANSGRVGELTGADGPRGSWSGVEPLDAVGVGLARVQGQANLGFAFAVADFDGDGREDVAVGVPRLGLERARNLVRDDDGAPRGGGVVIWSGAGAPSRLLGQAPADTNDHEDHFGHALAAGDFDGDGRTDLAVGAPYDDLTSGPGADSGRVFVFVQQPDGGLAATPSFVVDLDGLGVGSEQHRGALFGRSLAAGDLDGDGADELVIGAPLLRRARHVSQARSGAVVVLDGRPREGLDHGMHRVLFQGPGRDQRGDQFGHALVVADLDGDAYEDLVVGVPLEDVAGVRDAGTLHVLSGGPRGLEPRARRQRLVLPRPGPGDRLGWSLAAGDLDGDGRAELVAGAPYRTLGPPAVPAAEPGLARNAGVVTVWGAP